MASEIDFGDSGGSASKPEIEVLFTRLHQEGISCPPMIEDTFRDEKVSGLMLEKFTSEDERYGYLKNTAAFDNLRSAEQWRAAAGESGLFGPELTLPESPKADGSMRPAETGSQINLEYARKSGLDPDKVLVFRATQPTTDPKPEAYWTTDYYETRKGLSREMGEEKRASAVILVSTLGKINEGGGLIRDQNDDSGLPVRRIDSRPFDQKESLGII